MALIEDPWQPTITGPLHKGGSPQALALISFAALIALGTVLLALPIARTDNGSHWLDALFTATSAVCVTGLAVVDTGTDFTLFGQWVIMLLIQGGGLGVMTFAAIGFRILGRRLSLSSDVAVQDALFQRDLSGDFGHVFRRLLQWTLGLEAIGALLICVSLLPTQPFGTALYSAVFHAVSAFCNAGFSLYSDSLITIRNNGLFVTVCMWLVVTGGLGHIVLTEWGGYVYRCWRKPCDGKLTRLSLHSRVAMVMTGYLLVIGTVGIALMGTGGAMQTWYDRLWDGLIQSVMARTAGFNSVPLGMMPTASILLVVILMFIGGSPGSCAGGVKTTTTAIWLAQLRSIIKNEASVSLSSRRIPALLANRAVLIVGVSALLNTVGIMILSLSEAHNPGRGLRDYLFEQVSAFATVGLSTGLTPELSVIGRLWIIATMFVGRVGPLTVLLWLTPKSHVHIRHPEGSVMIG